MPKWSDPSVKAMLSAEETINTIEGCIEYYRHNVAYMRKNPNDWGPTVFGSEAAISACKAIIASAELLRKDLQPYWYGFEKTLDTAIGEV